MVDTLTRVPEEVKAAEAAKMSRYSITRIASLDQAIEAGINPTPDEVRALEVKGNELLVIRENGHGDLEEGQEYRIVYKPEVAKRLADLEPTHVL